MGVINLLRPRRGGLRRSAGIRHRSFTVILATLGAAVISLGIGEVAARAQSASPTRLEKVMAAFTSAPAHALVLVTPSRTVWEGVDLDGDGQADVANPTGHAPRGLDAYGEGRFHASRDGGSRRHEGVDYVARAGQTVRAPISGYVAKIGYAYPGDVVLRYVEIDNPALHIQARVFYVDPDVEVGQTVAIGHPIGRAHTLQQRYPGGITDHVHLEIADARGDKLDASTLILARTEPAVFAAD
jgi:murein DD-endopeptidase MepM/ murein hydrolase activator NlpD